MPEEATIPAVSGLVPSTTIALIFYHVAFKHPDTRISAPAVMLTGEYIRLFVQEAVLRANELRLRETKLIPAQKSCSDAEMDNLKASQNLGEEEDLEEDFNEYRGLGVATQLENEPPLLNVLEARHLAAVGGLLLMDF